MTDELVVLLGDAEVGRLRRSARGQLRFVYAEAYRGARNAYPLSLSMPLTRAEHGHDTIDPFL